MRQLQVIQREFRDRAEDWIFEFVELKGAGPWLCRKQDPSGISMPGSECLFCAEERLGMKNTKPFLFWHPLFNKESFGYYGNEPSPVRCVRSGLRHPRPVSFYRYGGCCRRNDFSLTGTGEEIGFQFDGGQSLCFRTHVEAGPQAQTVSARVTTRPACKYPLGAINSGLS